MAALSLSSVFLFLHKAKTPGPKWEKTDESYKTIKDLVVRLDPNLKGSHNVLKQLKKKKRQPPPLIRSIRVHLVTVSFGQSLTRI